ncbi:hypothetical protein GQ53DRAFT_645501 [Thozetella sp. PMI_491]|nr:hypothetical protein GQ53DRAFT_645501 [Thozetella sp. PMI_491]
MAATPFDVSLHPSNSFLFDIYHDGQPAALNSASGPAPAPVLPAGPCNYTDPTLPRCGCRRFWSRPQSVKGASGDSNSSGEVCMCSHHACFHEDIMPAQPAPPPAQTQAQPVAPANSAGQENERPKVNREPLSPVQDLDLPSFQLQSNLGSSLDFNMLNFQSSIVNNHLQVAVPAQVEGPILAQENSMPDTLNWGELIQSQGSASRANALPPIPLQCLMPSQHPPSTAASSQTRYLRPFAGKGLQTLSGVPDPSAGLPQERSSDATAPPVDFLSRADAEMPKPRALESQAVSLSGPSRNALQELSGLVQGHEQRINHLESTSFSVAGHEEWHEKHDHMDLRVTELESRVDEVERLLSNDNSSVGSSHRLRRDVDDANASVVSVSTNATARASRSEMYSQIQALQEQVNQLQAASLPTYTQPWELEVVFLPFPLKGVWLAGKDFPSQRQSAGNEEWTQMPNTISRATPDPQTPNFGEWVGPNREANWFFPRAFAAGRVIDQRLKSRGLIKSVLIRGSDARSIQLAINNTFGDVLRVSAGSAARSGYAVANSPMAEFFGLRQAWVPLRKLHKNSRLQFLAPAEMATPTLWDYAFLVSSVVMKATGTHRLYVTQPEAYLQDHPLGQYAVDRGWTWQKLRELSRVYPDSQSSSGDVPERDALEECWGWNDRLDEPPTPNVSASTLSMHTAQQFKQSRRSSNSPSQQFFTGIQSPILTNSPNAMRAQSPFNSRDRKGPRPPHIRTNSLPPAASIMGIPSPSQSRRRVSSYSANLTGPSPHERRSSPLIPHLHSSRASPRPQMTVSAMASKRRLGTRSPSLIPRNTPRYSRTSMSRSPSAAPIGLGAYFDDHRSERRTTPFCYATPYSNAEPPHAFPTGSSRAGSHGPVVIPRGSYAGHDENMDDDYENDDRGSSTDSDGGADDGFGGSLDRIFGEDNIDVFEDEDERDERDDLDAVETDAEQSQGHIRPEDIPWAGIEDEDRMSDGENVDPYETQSLSQSQSQEIEILEAEASGFAYEGASGQNPGKDYGSCDLEIVDGHDANENAESPGSRVGCDDEASDVSSLPSEYPSTQPPWNVPGTGSMTTRDESMNPHKLGGVSSTRARAVSVHMTDREDLEFHIHEDLPESGGDRARHAARLAA